MCIFCQIANHQQQAEIIYEDAKVVVFRDIKPKAKVHLLIIPKTHIESVNDLRDDDQELMGYLLLIAQKMAYENNVARTGYRLVINVGRGGGQIVDHLHLHLLGGGDLK